MKEMIMVIILLGVLHWYFNIRGKTRCIPITPECDGVNCIKQEK